MAQLEKTFALVTTSSKSGVLSVKTAFELGTAQRTMMEDLEELQKNTNPNAISRVSKDIMSARFKNIDEEIQFSIVTCETLPVLQDDKEYSQIAQMQHWSEEMQENNFIILDSEGEPVRFNKDNTIVVYGSEDCDGDVTKFDTRISVKEFLRLIDTYPWLF